MQNIVSYLLMERSKPFAFFFIKNAPPIFPLCSPYERLTANMCLAWSNI
jgi:hypothetical protein